MDLRIEGPGPTAAELSAVESVLGPGREEDPRAVHGGHEARSRRDRLLPVLQAVQARVGWISPGALALICRRLTVPPAEAYGVASFYALLSTEPRPGAVAHVCDDLACRLKGAEALCADLDRRLGPGAAWRRSPCLGLCEQAPAALVLVAGERSEAVSVAPASPGAILDALEGKAAADPHRPFIPQAGSPGLRLLRRVGIQDPLDLKSWEASGGLKGLRRALAIGPAAVIAEVTASRLVGRGGAAFPTGRKWEAVAAAPVRPHHLVMNADESEPGTFKDRILLEGDPLAALEGMVIAGFATGSAKGMIYLRGEYPLAASRIEAALDQARRARWLGPDVLGSGFAFDVEIRRGSGAYVCGEETALFNSIEGHRGEPRNKPPYPAEAGLFGKPTAVNNVETLANVPWILAEGAAAFASLGTPGSAGTKLFSVSGRVPGPGLYEWPFGITLRQALQAAGRGLPPRAVLLGGAAGGFVGPEALDAPLSFEGLKAIGASLGSGAVLVLDEGDDLMGLLGRIAGFFRDESCGQCVPCRIGTARLEEALARTRPGAASEGALISDLGRLMRDASICGLGQTASSAVESGLALLEREKGR